MATTIPAQRAHVRRDQGAAAAEAAAPPLHRALGADGLYIVAALCLLDVALVLARRHFGHMQNYRFIPWNLFLAGVPYGISLVVALLRRASLRPGWLLAPLYGLLYGLWLLFLPNAPYLLTDFVHLQDKVTLQVWYDTAMLASYAMTGYMLALASLGLMHRPVRDLLGWRAGWAFVMFALLLAGLGVHLGRAQRYNSWDILARTKPVVAAALDRVLHPLSHPHTMFDALYYTALLLVGYVAYLALRDKDTRRLILTGRAASPPD